MKKLIVITFFSVFLLTSCGGSIAAVNTLSAPDFATKIADKSVSLLDVRTPAEFAAGHIAGSTNIDFESGNFPSEITKLDKKKTYAVYCRSGNRSGQATALMAKDGFTSIYNLNGGIIEWQNSGNQLVTN